jgi:hypothetical protein
MIQTGDLADETRILLSFLFQPDVIWRLWDSFVEVTKGTGTRVSTSYYTAGFSRAVGRGKRKRKHSIAFYALRSLYYTRNSHFSEPYLLI